MNHTHCSESECLTGCSSRSLIGTWRWKKYAFTCMILPMFLWAYEWPQQQTPSLREFGRQLNCSLPPELRTLYCLFSSSHTHPVLEDFNLRPQLSVPLCFFIQHRRLWTGETPHSFEDYNSLALILILIQVPTQCIIFGRVFYQEPITRRSRRSI